MSVPFIEFSIISLTFWDTFCQCCGVKRNRNFSHLDANPSSSIIKCFQFHIQFPCYGKNEPISNIDISNFNYNTKPFLIQWCAIRCKSLGTSKILSVGSLKLLICHTLIFSTICDSVICTIILFIGWYLEFAIWF